MSREQLKSYQRLPSYLRPFVVEQDYERYTPREQATWRFIMRQSREFFKEHAHPVYLEGLKQTGIPISRIPNIEEMDAVLSRFGWGAVCVCGFIPPLAFLSFQAHRILPIAADMRTLEHIAYTPAPDIVHEAAGHAPILADPDYAGYLERYAALARKAIFSDEDIRLYEAIRVLSDVKENPDATAEDCDKAEAGLNQALAAMSWVSEAAQVARMNWWTAEYGLVGDESCPKIYGAGLLSSLGESRTCLQPPVKKWPFSLQCIEQGYDITRPQPQLYVAKDFKQLIAVLEELEEGMAFKQGGEKALRTGLRAKTVSTTVLDSGLEISGVLDALESIEGEQVAFIRWQGPVQLACHGQELAGHGRSRHASGFSSPLGPWQGGGGKDSVLLDDRELGAHYGLQRGRQAVLRFESGFTVTGEVIDWQRSPEGRLLLVSWRQCKVEKAGKCYFLPEWGEFDLAVGSSVVSVYGGPADLEHFGDYNFGKASTVPGRTTPFTAKEKELFALYQQARELRNRVLNNKEKRVTGSPASFSPADEGLLAKLVEEASEHFPHEWLLGVELYELLGYGGFLSSADEASLPPLLATLRQRVLNPARYDEVTRRFIALGQEMAYLED